MDFILRFFSEMLVMDWLYGNEILDLFNQYFISQSDANKVLIIIGLGFLSTLGAIQLVKSILKMTLLWVKIVLIGLLVYYLFVVVLGIDIWAVFRL